MGQHTSHVPAACVDWRDSRHIGFTSPCASLMASMQMFTGSNPEMSNYVWLDWFCPLSHNNVGIISQNIQ